MSMKMHMKQQQRGPTQTLSFVIAGLDNEEAVSNEININDLAWVRLRFVFNWYTGCVLESKIEFKKHEKAELSTVKIHWSCDEFERQCICPTDYDIVKMTPKPPHFSFGTTCVASLEVVITVHEITTSSISKVYGDTEFTDFELCASDGSVAVHKAFLSVNSDMFKTMLRGEWKETTEGRITMDGVNVQTLKHLKQYMYLGTLPDDGLETLLLLARHYLMDTLKADCITKLVETIRPDNAHSLIKFAWENNLPDLVTSILVGTRDTAIVNSLYQLKINKEVCKEN